MNTLSLSVILKKSGRKRLLWQLHKVLVRSGINAKSVFEITLVVSEIIAGILIKQHTQFSKSNCARVRVMFNDALFTIRFEHFCPPYSLNEPIKRTPFSEQGQRWNVIKALIDQAALEHRAGVNHLLISKIL